MKLYTLLALLGNASMSVVEDETYTNSYADCLAFALQFDNTCSDQTTATSFSSIPTKMMTCQLDRGVCPSHGTTSGSTCTFTRKLCVTCRNNNGLVKIRVQTDG